MRGTESGATAGYPALERLRRVPLPQRLLKGLWRFCSSKPLGAAGAAVVIIMALVAISAEVIAPHDPLQLNPRLKLMAPSATFLLGTDELGRDLLSRIIYGSRSALFIGFSVLATGTLFGVVLGITSGYFGGKFDLIVQRAVDAFQAFPFLIMALAIVAVLGQSLMNVILALAITLWPGVTRLVRGTTLSVKQEQYIDAARSMGAVDIRILLQHILPNVFAPIIVISTIQLGGIILAESSLSFLGLGTPPPTPTWGGMLSGSGRRFMELAPWMAVFPGLAITLAVLGFNLFGDALRDVLDPRLRGSR